MCLCSQNDDLFIKIFVQSVAQKKKFKSDSNNLIDRLYITMAMGHANFDEYFRVEVYESRKRILAALRCASRATKYLLPR